MNVLYASDDKFAGILAASLVSLFENNKQEEELQVFILDDGISPENRERLNEIFSTYGRKSAFLRVNDIEIPDAFISNRWPKVAFIRLFISDILDSSVHRLLYLDCDTIIQAPLAELWRTRLDGNIIAGVRDCLSFGYLENLGMDRKSPYINSGVLLIDLDQYREYHVKERVQRFIKAYAGVIRYPDQDVINAVFEGKIYTLPPQYNTLTLFYDFSYDAMCKYRKPEAYYTRRQIEQAVNSPVIIHFTTSFLSLRPWVENSRHRYKEQFLYYRSLSPWKDMPLWKDNTSGLKKAYVKIYRCVPRKWAVAFSGFLHATAVPVLKKRRNRG